MEVDFVLEVETGADATDVAEDVNAIADDAKYDVVLEEKYLDEEWRENEDGDERRCKGIR